MPIAGKETNTMSKQDELRPQDVSPATVRKATLILSIFLAVFATAVVVTIVNWFMYSAIQSEARALVVHDIQLVKTDK